jgi:sulfofructose kinase
MRRVICIGTAVVDTMFAVDRLPLAPGKNPARGVRHVCGGQGANAAATVSALGGKGVLWSRVGNDAAGEQILRELPEWNVETAAVQRMPGRHSVIATVLVDTGGERQLVYHMDPQLLGGAAEVPLADIAGAGALMTDTWWPQAAVPALAEARARDIPALVDVEPTAHPIDMKLLELASHVVFGREGLAAMAETPDIAQGLGRMREQTGAWLAVTCGGEGMYWLDDGQVRHLPAFEVEVVDTLAAGDVFHGALALALAERRPIEAALPFAAAAAAVKCTRFGGRDGIPNRAEVERLLGRLSPGC